MNRKALLSLVRNDYLLFSMAGVLVFLLYLPVTNLYFAADDFYHLVEASLSPSLMELLLLPTSETHIQPVLRFIFAGQFACFGVNPVGYYYCNIALHAINVFLLASLYRSVTGDRLGALCCGALFGLSTAHWRTVMWISTEGQLLATLWFLLGTLLFISYMRRRRPLLLILSATTHLLMLFSFTSGFELPLLYLLYLMMVEREGKLFSAGNLTRLLCIIPFVVNDALFLLFRRLVLPPGSKGIADAVGGSVGGIFMGVPKAAAYVVGGITEGYMRSFTGLYGAYVTPYHFLAIAVAIALLSIYALHDRPLMTRLLVCMALWMFIAYLIPALFRSADFSYHWFVTRSRYRYIPGVAASMSTVIIFRALLSRGSAFMRYLRPPLWILFIVVLSMNVVELRRIVWNMDGATNHLRGQVEEFVAELQTIVDTNPAAGLQVYDEPFYDWLSKVVGGNVFPSTLAQLYFKREVWEGMIFLRRHEMGRLDYSSPRFMFTPKNHLGMEYPSGEAG
ncbi:MAG: hypothetical protein ACE5D4_03465 [Thermodesulfobacteriota bacterium]